jgi:ketosteroid isomerase-like protein
MNMEANKVREIIEEWAAGVRARDIDAVLRRHAPELLMFDVVGPVRLQGLDVYRRTWIEQFFPWHGGTGRFELVDLKVSAGADVAFATALLECAGTEDGKKVAFTLRLTIGLEKRNGDWIIVHEHHPQPLDFDTALVSGQDQANAGRICATSALLKGPWVAP